MPFYPQLDANPLDVADQAAAAIEAGEADNPGAYVARELQEGRLRMAVTDPDAPENWPRVLTLWRSNLFGSSAKGNEYFLKHLLGTHSNLMATEGDVRPADVRWVDSAPEGKLDLLLSADFRMTSSTLLSDVVLPAATWYEKHDLSSTDMHPYVHAFTPAIDPPWEARSDFDMFSAIAAELSRLAERHLGTRRDLVMVPLQHDTPGETAQPGGVVRDWGRGQVPPVPGRTMPVVQVVERDYTAIADKLASIGPLAEKLGFTTKNVTFDLEHTVGQLAQFGGVLPSGPAAGRPAIDTDVKMAEAILALSGTTNGELAVQGFHALERRVGRPLADLAAGSEEKRITFAQTQTAPVPVITSPEWSGSETGGRRYAPFTLNVERLVPWRTLTGRMHFYLDHDWMRDVGEGLPQYRPPLDMHRLFGDPVLGADGSRTITVRYLTPHNKWSIHSEYQDNLFMLSLSRGGTLVWMSPADAGSIGAADNDWVECVNGNGVLVGRAVVSHRMPDGVVYVHHAQERMIDVPKSEATGRRGGIHNSVTRLLVKPTHLIGGYAQLSYAFNYLGPTGKPVPHGQARSALQDQVRKRNAEGWCPGHSRLRAGRCDDAQHPPSQKQRPRVQRQDVSVASDPALEDHGGAGPDRGRADHEAVSALQATACGDDDAGDTQRPQGDSCPVAPCQRLAQEQRRKDRREHRIQVHQRRGDARLDMLQAGHDEGLHDHDLQQREDQEGRTGRRPQPGADAPTAVGQQRYPCQEVADSGQPKRLHGAQRRSRHGKGRCPHHAEQRDLLPPPAGQSWRPLPRGR
jgi:nitrate reductase alpha subunit